MTVHSHETFRLQVPPEWTVRGDDDRVYFVSTEPPGVLCCTAQRVQDAEELPNLSRMLAGFLTRSGHPVATDDLLVISGNITARGFCWQYFEDGSFCRIWIFGNQTSWLLITFNSAVEHLDDFHPVLEQVLKTLVLVDDEGSA